ncbi:hypothetical protein HK097_005119, partial [Rhizophlyctis rosea]
MGGCSPDHTDCACCGTSILTCDNPRPTHFCKNNERIRRYDSGQEIKFDLCGDCYFNDDQDPSVDRKIAQLQQKANKKEALDAVKALVRIKGVDRAELLGWIDARGRRLAVG